MHSARTLSRHDFIFLFSRNALALRLNPFRISSLTVTCKNYSPGLRPFDYASEDPVIHSLEPTTSAPQTHISYTCTRKGSSRFSRLYSSGVARGCGPHRAALARGGKGAKNAENFFKTIHMKIQIVRFIYVCVQEKQSVTASVYLSSAITMGTALQFQKPKTKGRQI